MRHDTVRHQHGLALLPLLVILAASLLATYRGWPFEPASHRHNRQVLQQARDALLASAISDDVLNGDVMNARPGTLPCPDTSNSGYAASCGNSKASLGRLPWRSLRLPRLVDASGEPLWYAVSAGFRRCTTGCTPLNSLTPGNLLLRAPDGSGTLASDVVLVLIAPGRPLPGQQRDPARASTLTQASNYLESFLGANHTQATGPFIDHPATDSFNDQILVVRREEFALALERKVAHEMLRWLRRYRDDPGNAAHTLPAPGNPLASTCRNTRYATSTPCTSDTALCTGRLPARTSGSTPWPPAGHPDWLENNLWNEIVTYSVAGSALTSPPPGCPSQQHHQGRTTQAILEFAGQRLPARRWSLP